MRVGYLGPQGTYSHEVALAYFASPDCTLIPFDTLDEVIIAAEERKVDVSAVPIDNSHEGPVVPTLDQLGRIARAAMEKRARKEVKEKEKEETQLAIVGEHYHNVEHCLLGAKNVVLEEVEGIYSHPQALGQCRQWLSAHFPKAVIHSVSSTAKAAQMVCSNPKSVAVSSAGAAKEYGLEILRKGIQDSQYNQTRFVFLSAFPIENFLHFSHLFTPKESTKKRISLYFTTEEGDYSLSKFLAMFTNLNLISIYSRPIQNTAWKKGYFIDFEYVPLRSTTTNASAWVLGCYPMRTDQRLTAP